MCVHELRGAPRPSGDRSGFSDISPSNTVSYSELGLTKAQGIVLPLFLSSFRFCFLFPAITVTVVKRVLDLDSSRGLQADFPTPGLVLFPLHWADSKPA